MKKHLVIGFALLFAAASAVQSQVTDIQAREALRNAADQAVSSLDVADVAGAKTIALLPLGRDVDGVLASALKSAISAAELACVEAKDDPFFEEIMKQVEWDERKEDMLDEATITRFGRLQAGQLLLYGWIRQCDVSQRRAYAEIELHLSSVETKRHLWGGCFASRVYLDPGVKGIIDLDETSRELLRQIFAAASQSLAASAKTGDLRSVAIVPLAGDVDHYATGLAMGMFSSLTKLSPRDLSVATLAEAVDLLRTDSSRADALLYGAVRDLSSFLVKEDVFRGDTYRYHAEVQLRIQTAKGDIVWSDTLPASVEVQVPPADRRTVLVRWLLSHPREIALAVGGILALLVVLAVFRMFFRAVSRPR
ncbi:MAG TPA: hypothetical protein PKY10_03595 [Lentisphaeria bacterium]|mgnify:CR=1 FL=1|nr:hypothetical protein [Lentisphaeria bacterium]